MVQIRETFRQSLDAYCSCTNQILGRDALLLAGACSASAPWLAWLAMLGLIVQWADAFREQEPYLRTMRHLHKPEMQAKNILRRCSPAVIGFTALGSVAVLMR